MKDCIFCKIVEGEVPSSKVYENDHTYAFLDINPTTHGHILVIPKRHYADIHDIDEDTLFQMVKTTKLLSTKIKEALNSTGVNIVLNNGSDAGQIVFHSHIHIIPRDGNDGLKPWPHGQYKDGESEEILEKIKKAL